MPALMLELQKRIYYYSTRTQSPGLKSRVVKSSPRGKYSFFFLISVLLSFNIHHCASLRCMFRCMVV